MRRRATPRREAALDLGVALGINAGFLGIVALVLWGLGQAALAGRLAWGYGLLWLLLVASLLLVTLVERIFRLNVDDHFTAVVTLNAAVCAVLVAGWSAFAALAVRAAALGVPLWRAAVLYGLGVAAGYVAFAVATAFYSGSIYKLISLPLALVGFVLFAVWPAAARALFGWFFGLAGWAP